MGNKNTKSPSKLDEREIQLLISNTNFTREQILQWHSAFLLEYKDGHISKKEFVELFKQLYNQGNPEKFAKFAFLVFDKVSHTLSQCSYYLIILLLRTIMGKYHSTSFFYLHRSLPKRTRRKLTWRDESNSHLIYSTSITIKRYF